MAYDVKVLRRAIGRLEAQRAEHERLIRDRRSRLYAEIPRLGRIAAELRMCGASIAESIISSPDSAAAIAQAKAKSGELRAERGRLLAAAGYPEDYLDDRPLCEKCGDTGYIGSKPCACLAELYGQEQTAELSDLFRIAPGRFRDFDASLYSDKPFGEYKATPRENIKHKLVYCKKYADSFGAASESIFITGDCGLGKTYLSACIARTVVAAGYSVVYESAFSVAKAMEDERFSHDDELREDIDRLYKCDLLIIDDLGTEMTTSYTVACFYDLINRRLTESKKTIISSNLTTGEIRLRYNPQIASRIDEEYKILFLYGESVRLAAAKKRGEPKTL